MQINAGPTLSLNIFFDNKNVAHFASHFFGKGLRLFPDWRWGKEIRRWRIASEAVASKGYAGEHECAG